VKPQEYILLSVRNIKCGILKFYDFWRQESAWKKTTETSSGEVKSRQPRQKSIPCKITTLDSSDINVLLVLSVPFILKVHSGGFMIGGAEVCVGVRNSSENRNTLRIQKKKNN